MLMKIIKINCSIFIMFMMLNAFSAITLTDETSIDLIIRELTPSEKAKLVVGTGVNSAMLVQGAAGATFAIPRLGIPQIVMAEGPAGVGFSGESVSVTSRYATAFPVPVALASSWNENLLFQVASTIGDEAKSYGIDLLLAPALNIQRDPLNGRNFEYFSEDPYLTGKMSAAFVNGLQSRGVGATLKHFVAFNQETQRHSIDQQISERALREIYLAGFEYAIKNSKPWAVMSASPSINGTFVSQSSQFLKTILRSEWGFNGVVMSSWDGVHDPLKALPAGNDLIMPGGIFKQNVTEKEEPQRVEDIVKEGIEQGFLQEDTIDENIRAILGLVIKTPIFKGNQPEANPQLDSHTYYAHSAAIESMVLLKNNYQTLPILVSQKIAVFGRNSQHFHISGNGSIKVNVEPGRTSNLAEGMAKVGYRLITSVNDAPLHEGISSQNVIDAANQSDIAIISLGRSSSEGADRYSMALNSQELQLIKNVSRVYHAQNKRVVVLLNIGAPIEMAMWDMDVDAILLTWQPGQEAGNAIAEILSGKESPSGKLPVTFPKYYRDVPSYGNFPGKGNKVNYGEGIYVGYRFYDSKCIQPMYPFGHGLSYSDFTYSNIKLSQPLFDLDTDENISVYIDIQNSGSVTAKEVVQLYIHDKASRVDRPLQELKGFRKIELNPEEKQTVSFIIDKRALSFFDTERNRWVVEPGRFTVRIGSSSRDIRQEIEFKATSRLAPAITLKTRWVDIQTYNKAASIVANYIDDDEMNIWLGDKITLGDRMDAYFTRQPSLKDNKVAQHELLHKLLSELNDL